MPTVESRNARHWVISHFWLNCGKGDLQGLAMVSQGFFWLLRLWRQPIPGSLVRWQMLLLLCGSYLDQT